MDSRSATVAGPGDPGRADILASHGIEASDVEAVNAASRRSFYKKREKIYPKRVAGRFRLAKWVVMAVTLIVYYGTPWLRWDRGMGAPDQAVLIDFPGRRFYFFFIELWPQEVYYITGLLILAALSLFLITALAGRVWCGYTCPQTVWTDLFLVIERAIEGDRNSRIKLDRAQLSVSKFGKKIFKHSVFLLVALLTGGAWIFYFADAPSLAKQLVEFTAPMEAYIFMGVFAAFTYGLGAIAREQWCIYGCPWPRIQAALTDEDAMAITYRFDRGEPRGAHKKGESWDGRGDCVDCRQCVAACPMGVDIREGLQLECIQCALCIDACDAVMTKVGRPSGLIAYDTDVNIARRQRGEKTSFRLIRPRTIIYAVLLAVVGAVMLTALIKREDLDLSVLRDRNPTYTLLSSGEVRNGYTVKLLNKARLGRSFILTIDGLDGAELTGVGLRDDADGGLRVPVDGDELRSVRIFITLPRMAVTSESLPVRFVIHPDAEDDAVAVDSVFLGPKP
ncbi:MAG: cytochrome c oxidase accessory protein CcoG [Rhodobacteraceae bacterium]|nr:cytochrome c oxidase accessory protein CcoG [Paracoccaceae bacterium]